ncbi:MAG: hypothetical protein GDA46_02305 [Bdellovibrionales bacterium]|nr:hypothetical protein [Bdellovibrionales bacterium]
MKDEFSKLWHNFRNRGKNDQTYNLKKLKLEKNTFEEIVAYFISFL